MKTLLKKKIKTIEHDTKLNLQKLKRKKEKLLLKNLNYSKHLKFVMKSKKMP